MSISLKQGMTVVEVLVVILVLVILFGIVGFSYNSWRDRSATNAVKNEVIQAANQARSQRNFNSSGHFPATSSFNFEASPKVTLSYTQTSGGR